jgi:hypothetical protein
VKDGLVRGLVVAFATIFAMGFNAPGRCFVARSRAAEAAGKHDVIF